MPSTTTDDYEKLLQQMLGDHQAYWTRGERAWAQYVPAHENAATDYQAKKFNIFWSNVNTVRPNLYFQRPGLRVKRRILESQPLSILSSDIAQRVGEFNLDEQTTFNRNMMRVVTDYLVPGRGQMWVSYEPVIGHQRYDVQVMQDEDGLDVFIDSRNLAVDEKAVKKDEYERLYHEEEALISEKICVEHVHWRDFIHNPARTWEEVTVVGRALYLTKEDAKKRFGKKADDLSYTQGHQSENQSKVKTLESAGEKFDRTRIWELWDKEQRQVIYISEDGKEVLKKISPPIAFKRFFPCPEPLTSTATEDSLLPYSDYYFYEKQADNLNSLTSQIDVISGAVKWSGAYNAKFGVMLKHVLEGMDAQFVPVKEWSSFLQTGGFEGNVLIPPLEALQKTLLALYQARDIEKQETYEITGIADILRGVSNPNETATAQREKAANASLRLAERQQEMQQLMRDVYALMIEAGVESFNIKTLAQMSGAHAQNELFPQAIELLKNDQMRTFAIDVETDATLRADEDRQKQAVTEFLGVFQQALSTFRGIVQDSPELAGVAGQMLTMAVRQFSAGRNLEEGIEQAIEQAVAAIQERASKPQQPPPPTPKEQVEMQKLQQKSAKDQADHQIKTQEVGIKAMEAQIRAKDSETKRQKVLVDATIAAERLESDTQRAAIETYDGRLEKAQEAATRYGALYVELRAK